MARGLVHKDWMLPHGESMNDGFEHPPILQEQDQSCVLEYKASRRLALLPQATRLTCIELSSAGMTRTDVED